MPTPPDIPEDPPPPVEEPPPFNPGPKFSWDNARGVLLFAGTQGTESQLRSLIGYIRTQWGNKRLIFNVCSETAEWESTPWADGPNAFSGENQENLKRFLRVTAEEGVMVRLNIFCTIRDSAAFMEVKGEDYAKMVVAYAKKYDHVFLSVANEPYHPNSWLRSSGRVRRMRDVARDAGFTGPMGADDTINREFVYGYAGLGFPTDFHPFRNPDPGPSDFRRMIAENSRPVIISEPTAYSSWREGGCCTADKAQIIAYFRRAEREGIVMFYHSTSGLEWPRKPFEWIPVP